MSKAREQFEQSTDYTFSMAISKDPEYRAKYWKAYAKWLQSAYDKLKERIECAQKTETDENGFIDVNYFLNTNDERQTIALVELTPEEMEKNDE